MIGKCEICPKEYYIRPSHWRRVKRHFCGNECKGKGLSGKDNPAFKDSWIKICVECGGKYRYLDGARGKRFCSQRCMGIYRTKTRTVKKSCRGCGISIIAIKANSFRENVCSKKCADVVHALRMIGSGNPNWMGGIGKLPWSWEFNKKLKEKVKSRDGNKCGLCKKTEEELIKIKGIGLQVHHIDYNKSNNNIENLISLCNNCHGRVNYNRELWKPKLYNLLQG